MVIPKKIVWLCIFVLTVTMTSCSNKQPLTLEKVIELSHKGQELSWDDFERYDSKEIGSGLYILRYEIDETYSLLIGGNSPKHKPAYIRLVKADHSEKAIDIRESHVEEFISK